jgi:hypothetical protein
LGKLYFSPTAFENGLHNAGELRSCKLFALQELEQQQLVCFGAYQEDVLGILMEQVTRTFAFMKTGWDGCILWRSFRIEENYLIIMINFEY